MSSLEAVIGAAGRSHRDSPSFAVPDVPLLWQCSQMSPIRNRMTPRLVDSLYVEAMLLADEARAYFDQHGREDRMALDPLVRVGFSCESLKVTTRLMHVIAWLLTQRAVEAGELSARQARNPERRLGDAPDSDGELLARLPKSALNLIQASRELYARVQRLDEGSAAPEPQPSPARSLMRRLERSL